MQILDCLFKNFKNLNCTFSTNKRINFIYGKNAQGKTNFLEAINLFSGDSVSKNKVCNLINFKENYCNLQMNFLKNNESHFMKIIFNKNSKNQFSCNKIKYKNLNEFYGKIYSIFFSPKTLQVIDNSPEVRRKFLNNAVSQLKPTYLKYYRQYMKILNQRNYILKNKNFYSDNLLETFSTQLAKLGTIVTIFRFDYVDKLNKIAVKIYNKIASNEENLQIKYKSTVFEEQIAITYKNKYYEEYLKKLNYFTKLDKKTGFTNIGIHKDDLKFKLNGFDLKIFGSQGQKKTCAVTLKLAQSKLIFMITTIRPIILLDEVLSELDSSRQKLLLNCLNKNQLFISLCDLTRNLDFNSFDDSAVYLMENGNISSYKP